MPIHNAEVVIEEEKYLYGCLEESSGSLDSCVPGYSSGNVPVCTRRVYSRDKESRELTLQNNVKSDRAYVYLDREDAALSPEENKLLFERDFIREIYTYSRTAESCSFEHVETVSNLRPNKEKRRRSEKKTKRELRREKLLQFLLIIILIIVFLWLISY